MLAKDKNLNYGVVILVCVEDLRGSQPITAIWAKYCMALRIFITEPTSTIQWNIVMKKACLIFREPSLVKVESYLDIRYIEVRLYNIILLFCKAALCATQA